MKKTIATIVPLLFLTACGINPPKPNVAQAKTVEVDGKTITLGGEYWVKKNQLILFVNDEPLMRGKFPPYTPTLNLNATYEGVQLNSHCYFGSVLQSEGGIVGVVSGAIQGAKGKSGDKCDLKVGPEATETLYF